MRQNVTTTFINILAFLVTNLFERKELEPDVVFPLRDRGWTGEGCTQRQTHTCKMADTESAPLKSQKRLYLKALCI